MGNRSENIRKASIEGKMHEESVFARLSREVKYLEQIQLQKDHNDLWSNRMDVSLRKFLKDDRTIDKETIRDFRRVETFLSEAPRFQSLFPINWISGSRRGQRLCGKERLEVLKREGDIEYLEKYPICLVGNPYFYVMDGYCFNERWSRHVRYIHLAVTHLDKLLRSGTAKVLDIGGGYGIFAGLLKQEFGQIRSGIVEFPEQLLLAYYYLAMNFPDAKINTLQDIDEVETVDNNFVEKYDFLLIPIHCYAKIKKDAFSLVTNFNSFAEMSEEWFAHYLNADAVRNAEYLFTLNRFESRPTYDTDINILDYRLHEFHKLHFRISPLFGRYYERRLIFFRKQQYFTSQCFEFIGKRNSGESSG